MREISRERVRKEFSRSIGNNGDIGSGDCAGFRWDSLLKGRVIWGTRSQGLGGKRMKMGEVEGGKEREAKMGDGRQVGKGSSVPGWGCKRGV